MRAPQEAVDETLRGFYQRLLAVLRRPVVRDGAWKLLECTQAWEGNGTNDCFIVALWQRGDERLLAVVNYAAHHSQCYVRIPDLAGRAVRLTDLMSEATYDRAGDELSSKGLYLDVAPWGYHAFDLGSA